MKTNTATTEITNDFHQTSARIRATVGDQVSKATMQRVARDLCGISDCTCGRQDGSRYSRYTIEETGRDIFTVVDNQDNVTIHTRSALPTVGYLHRRA